MITDEQIDKEARACLQRYGHTPEAFGGIETDHFVIAKDMAVWAREQLKSGMRPTFEEWLATIDKTIHGPFYQGGGLTHYYPNHMRMAWDACETFMSFMMTEKRKEDRVYILGQPKNAHEVADILIEYIKKAVDESKRINELEESVARAVKQAHDAGLVITKLREEKASLEQTLIRVGTKP